MNWNKIIEKGLDLAKNNEIRRDDEYKIIKDLYPTIDNRYNNHHYNSKPLEECHSMISLALMSKSPSHAFEYWREQGLLKMILPELDMLWGRIQPELYHPEIDVGIHAMMVVDRSAYYNLSLDSRYAALFHDFGKSLTPLNQETHYGHEYAGVPLVEKYLKRWGFNKQSSNIILSVVKYHGEAHNYEKRSPNSALKLFIDMNLFDITNESIDDNQEYFNRSVLEAIKCDDLGRKNMYNSVPKAINKMQIDLDLLNKNKIYIFKKIQQILNKKEQFSLVEQESHDIEQTVLDLSYRESVKVISKSRNKNKIGVKP